MQAAAGNIARFQLIFKLTSDVNDNYLHIHTMKGILVASRVTSPCVFLVAAELAHPTASHWLAPCQECTRMLYRVLFCSHLMLCTLCDVNGHGACAGDMVSVQGHVHALRLAALHLNEPGRAANDTDPTFGPVQRPGGREL